MTSLLTTAVDESCQSGATLRDRRRSSVHPLTAIPRFFFLSQSNVPHPTFSNNTDESALSDDVELTSGFPDAITDSKHDFQSSPGSVPELKEALKEISPLCHAHVSDYAPKLIIPRHQDSLGSSTNYTSTPTSPRSSSPTTVVNSRRGSYDDQMSITHTLQRCNGTVDGYNKKEKFERMKWRLAAGYFAYFMCGWGDGITGTVLPFFMADFHLSFTTSSLLFLATTCGFFTGTLLVEAITRGLSRTRASQERSAWYPYFSFPSLTKSLVRKPESNDVRNSFVQSRHLALALASVLHATFFVLMGTRAGYSILFVAYVVSAFARAILTAALNLYFNTVMPQSISYSYAFWSFGGVISPLICQTLVSAGIPWFRFYLGSLVLSAFNTGLLTLTFRPTTREWIKECHSNMRRSERDNEKSANISTSVSAGNGEAKLTQKSKLRWSLSIGTTWAFSIFSLLYCGCETTTQGFMVSYLLGNRHANPKTVGYVTSGFWGGITVGRLVWGYFMPKFNFTQRKWIVHTCLTVGLVMQMLIWFVNSNIGNAFFASVIGVVFGPIYPAALSLATANLPQEVHMVAMALIGAAGSIGSSIFPLVTGIISSLQGIHVLSYITVALAGWLFIMWFFFPSRVNSTR